MLHGNRSVLHKSPGRFLAGTVASGDRDAFNKHGMMRNRFQAVSALAAIPFGYVSPAAWVLPKTAGGMSSHSEADFALSATAQGWMGLPGSGTASFVILVPDAEGWLIASGNGSASLSITAADLLLTASLNGFGTATFSLTTNTPVLGAEASGIGSSVFTFTATATILPVDDSPPARTAIATFYVTGNLTPYAIGHMIGSALPGDGGITVTVDTAAIADAVWAKVIEGTITAADFQRIFGAALAGEVSGMGTNAPVFRSADGTKDRITATTDASGNRMAVTLDGAP